MSVVLCLPAHLRVSTAASRGQAPHGNASVLSSGGPLLSIGCCRFWLGGPPGFLWGFPLLVPSGWGVFPLLVGGRLRGCGPFSCPSTRFFFRGGVCLFLPLPSLGWCTHWSAFSVASRVAVGACVLLGLAPAPWVGWVMYTLGVVALLDGLGSGSAGWAVEQGGFVRPWVRGAGVSRVSPPPRSRN